MNFESVNPFTEQQLAVYNTITSNELEQAIALADKAQQEWRLRPVSERVHYFETLGSLIRDNHEHLARLATLEMGKPLAEARLEVLKCARGCDFYAANSADLLRVKTSIAETGKTVHVSYEPLGVVLGIFPWNFPYWQILRSAVPTVIAGNAMLVKPAPNVPQCSIAMQEIIEKSGLPKGLITVIFADEKQVENMIADKRIKAVTLTGSDKAGSIVAGNAGKHIKKSVLELGGSDPFIVLDDADLKHTLEQAITARFQNNGQSCIAAKRFILHEKIADEFLTGLMNNVQALTCGDPLNDEVRIGPLARKDLKDKLAHQVNASVQKGAVIHYQQTVFPDKGFFYPPTILTHVNSSCEAYSEELFGPVISVFVVGNDADAIRIANDTDFGLGASVWSNNIERATALARQIESGQVFINEMVKSQPSHPFGGVKKSGYGRELGEYGLYEFCNIKALWI